MAAEWHERYLTNAELKKMRRDLDANISSPPPAEMPEWDVYRIVATLEKFRTDVLVAKEEAAAWKAEAKKHREQRDAAVSQLAEMRQLTTAQQGVAPDLKQRR